MISLEQRKAFRVPMAPSRKRSCTGLESRRAAEARKLFYRICEGWTVVVPPIQLHSSHEKILEASRWLD